MKGYAVIQIRLAAITYFVPLEPCAVSMTFSDKVVGETRKRKLTQMKITLVFVNLILVKNVCSDSDLLGE